MHGLCREPPLHGWRDDGSAQKKSCDTSAVYREKKKTWLLASPAGGYAAHSLAIMTDAAHLLADFGSIAISLFSLWLASRPPTGVMTFGWHRAGEENSSAMVPRWKE